MSAAILDMLSCLLGSNSDSGPQTTAALRSTVLDVLQALKELPGARGQEGAAQEGGLEGAAKAARRCHRAFERLREEHKDRSEAHRKERKRRRDELKIVARRQVPTPMLKGDLADLKQKAQVLQGLTASPPDLDAEDFIIRRPRDDMEDDD